MGKTNNNWTEMSDTAIVKTIGAFIKQERLKINKTQAQLATEAGINRWTLGQIENGEAITLISLIQIMRALDILYLFEGFTVKQEISPLELAKQDQNKRQRASKNTIDNSNQSDW
ncbi:MAG: helix-turn-helix transcriptional regulator [Bacteroidetes bacterium]|nr:helix-turn-helix transcriptional regulator [Bacteroidota bacterium]